MFNEKTPPTGSLQAWLGLTLAFCTTLTAAEDPIEFNRDIRPILSENCFYCHGADSNNRQAGLRLDDHASALESGVLAPHSSGSSQLIARVMANDASVMPPAESNRHLTPAQKKLLRQWVEQGAQYQQHWAFESIRNPSPPRHANNPWVRNPIDAFALGRLEKEGLAPTKEATPERWLRRVSLDLIGLPPEPQDLDAFLAAVRRRGESAYGEKVDELLASPHYGERMAIDWMDVARYADTHGFNNDSLRSMWRWRDWVIESFNGNLPYDQFITEQLAGDLLPSPTLDQVIATGFNRNHVINSEGGIIEEEYRVEYVADRVRTLSMAWLGLTMECARCHDHKYDPFSQRDFYRLFAYFNSVQEWGEDGRVANAPPMIQAPTRAQQEEIADYERQIAALEEGLDLSRHGWAFNQGMTDAIRHAVDESASHAPQKQAFTLGTSTTKGALAESAVSFPHPNKDLTIPASKLRFGQGTPTSFAFWLRQEKGNPSGVPLISAINYLLKPSAQSYGRGAEIRLVDGEIEYSLSRRYPAYSITVRSKGAAIRPDQWRHVAVVYRGSRGQEQAKRCKAECVRIWIDGELVDLDILHDNLQYGSPNGGALAKQGFRIGHSSKRGGPRFHGQLAGLNAFRRALSDEEVDGLFLTSALPHALSQLKANTLTLREQTWLRDAYLAEGDATWASRRRELRRLQEARLAVFLSAPSTMVMQEMPTPRQAYVLQRGMYDSPGDPVAPGVMETLLPMPGNAPANRLGLAQWLTDPDHPLTARVVVNRFWQQLFGMGLVKTSEDFGYQGEWPSHPELLDWLATDFLQSNWDVKRLLKQIVLSSTYRQDSDASPELLENDPENRLLARGPRFRLPAELIRDQALQASGLLVRSIGGPSVRPYQPKGLYQGIIVGANYPGTSWKESRGDGLYRRSLYTFMKRTAPHPAMVGFDAPDREVCTVRRSSTNTPLQALHLLNGPIYLEASRKLAERVLTNESLTSDEQQIKKAFRIATSRDPSAQEITLLAALLDKSRRGFARRPDAASQLLAAGNSPVSSSIAPPELAAWTMVASVLLNLDETITRN